MLASLVIFGRPWYRVWIYIGSQLVCLNPLLFDYQRDSSHFLHHQIRMIMVLVKNHHRLHQLMAGK